MIKWINLLFKSPEAFKWLIHYLLGSGENLPLPNKCRKEAIAVIKSAIAENGIDDSVCIGDSRIYEGVGFLKKPTLFYLVGGFTAKIKFSNSKFTRFSIEDVYDWHPDCNGKWSWSATPFPKFIGKILSKFFPDLFNAGDYCMAVSNKLWSIFGKPFKTYGMVDIQNSDIDEMLEYYNSCHEDYDYYEENEEVDNE